METKPLEELWDQYCCRLLAFIRRRVSNEADAEDILQEVFIRIQRARLKLRDLLLACCHFELDRRGRIMDYYERCCCCNPAGSQAASLPILRTCSLKTYCEMDPDRSNPG